MLLPICCAELINGLQNSLVRVMQTKLSETTISEQGEETRLMRYGNEIQLGGGKLSFIHQIPTRDDGQG
jgi:hypothetical protein